MVIIYDVEYYTLEVASSFHLRNAAHYLKLSHVAPHSDEWFK